jgi:hypothetical protein
MPEAPAVPSMTREGGDPVEGVIPPFFLGAECADDRRPAFPAAYDFGLVSTNAT